MFFPFKQIHRCTSLNLQKVPPQLFTLSALAHLDLSHNALTSLPDSISTLYNLHTLDVSFNQIRFLPASLGKLHVSLQVLRVTNNPIRSPPSQVLARDTKHILQYLLSLVKTSSPLYKVKLMVLGEHKSGKTSILKCMKSASGDHHLGARLSGALVKFKKKAGSKSTRELLKNMTKAHVQAAVSAFKAYRWVMDIPVRSNTDDSEDASPVGAGPGQVASVSGASGVEGDVGVGATSIIEKKSVTVDAWDFVGEGTISLQLTSSCRARCAI